MRQGSRMLYRMVYTGLMAAMIFTATYFLKIGPIPTPVGSTQIKTGNILCLLAGLLFGGLYGGLASGIGSMFFDLLNPEFARHAFRTLILFFLMGASCGWISRAREAKTRDGFRNVLGAVSGALLYYVLYLASGIAELMIAGSDFLPALFAHSVKMITSGINAVVAVVCSLLLIRPVRKALESARVLEKFQ